MSTANDIVTVSNIIHQILLKLGSVMKFKMGPSYGLLRFLCNIYIFWCNVKFNTTLEMRLLEQKIILAMFEFAYFLVMLFITTVLSNVCYDVWFSN